MPLHNVIREICRDHFLVQRPEGCYFNEASLQLKLGIELWKRCGVDPILEKKHPTKGEYLDVFFPWKGVRWGIEIKYKTKRSGMRFGHGYANHGAQYNGRYDVVKDIGRLESFIQDDLIDHGFCLFITNDEAYQKDGRSSGRGQAFRLTQGRQLNGLLQPDWKDRATAISLVGNYDLNWEKPEENSNGEVFAMLLIPVSFVEETVAPSG